MSRALLVAAVLLAVVVIPIAAPAPETFAMAKLKVQGRRKNQAG